MPSQHQPPQLERALSALETSEALVLRLRTGLVDGHRHSLLEVGEFLGATRTEARSLEWSGWQKLEARARGDRESLVALRYLLGRTKTSSHKQRSELIPHLEVMAGIGDCRSQFLLSPQMGA